MLYRSDEKQVKECRQTCKRVSDRKYFIPANDVEEKGKICFDVCDIVRDRMDKNANRSWELRRAVA